MADTVSKVYSVEDVVKAGDRVIRGIERAFILGTVALDEAAGVKSGVIGVMLALGMDVSFQDGTVMRLDKEETVHADHAREHDGNLN